MEGKAKRVNKEREQQRIGTGKGLLPYTQSVRQPTSQEDAQTDTDTETENDNDTDTDTATVTVRDTLTYVHTDEK